MAITSSGGCFLTADAIRRQNRGLGLVASASDKDEDFKITHIMNKTHALYIKSQKEAFHCNALIVLRFRDSFPEEKSSLSFSVSQ